MKLADNIVVRTARDTAEGFREIATGIWGFIGHPSQWRPRMEAAKLRREDLALQTSLNRDIRRQFIEAFTRSTQKKMTVGAAGIMRQYKARNGWISTLLRPYEKYSNWRMSAKIAGAAIFFRAARKALWPVMGAWGMIVPLAAFVGARMAIVYREAKNKQQEAELAKEGFIVPCTFEVKDKKVSILGREMTQDFFPSFPVMYTETPEWVVARYDALKKALDKPQPLHAAGFEALRAGTLVWDDIKKIRDAFPEQEQKQGFAYALSVLFPGTDAIAQTRQMSSEETPVLKPAEAFDPGVKATFRRLAKAAKEEDKSLPATALAALSSFCMAEKDDAGLTALAGRVSPDDLRYLSGLRGLNAAPDRAQAEAVTRMIQDPRFDTLSFRDITEVALAPAAVSAAFDDLWKDREYRARFDLDFLRDVAFNINGWGATALRISRHDYSQNLSSDDIRELAAPQNELWAPIYHRLQVSQPEAAATLTHGELKALVQEYGIKAGEALAGNVIVPAPQQAQEMPAFCPAQTRAAAPSYLN